MENLIEIKNVYKTYKMGKVENHALNNINLNIKNGEPNKNRADWTWTGGSGGKEKGNGKSGREEGGIFAVVPVLAAFTVSSVTCNSERIRGPHVGL